MVPSGVTVQMSHLPSVLASRSVAGPFLLRHTKYAVLICFVVAAVITPTGDIVNMMIIGVPMIALYLLGVVIAFIFGKKRKKEE